jgi:hypothetical protein
MADRFRAVVRWRLGGEELAERTHVREQAPQPARPHRAADRKRDAGSGGPSWTRTRSQWIKNPSKASQRVTNRENTGDTRCPIATDQTTDAVSKPLPALSRGTLIALLYDHASALAQAGDIEAARVAHEAAGRLLVVPEPAHAVVDLNQRRKP